MFIQAFEGKERQMERLHKLLKLHSIESEMCKSEEDCGDEFVISLSSKDYFHALIVAFKHVSKRKGEEIMVVYPDQTKNHLNYSKNHINFDLPSKVFAFMSENEEDIDTLAKQLQSGGYTVEKLSFMGINHYIRTDKEEYIEVLAEGSKICHEKNLYVVPLSPDLVHRLNEEILTNYAKSQKEEENF